jgi:hypothetical protein
VIQVPFLSPYSIAQKALGGDKLAGVYKRENSKRFIQCINLITEEPPLLWLEGAVLQVRSPASANGLLKIQ